MMLQEIKLFKCEQLFYGKSVNSMRMLCYLVGVQKGSLACPCCNYGTNSLYLKHSRKMCYMDHRIFLPMDHPWRSNKRSFNGKTEFRLAPPLLKGTDVLNDLQNINNVFEKNRREQMMAHGRKSQFLSNYLIGSTIHYVTILT